MADVNGDAVMEEALLLSSHAEFWKLATKYTRAMCSVYVAPNPYPEVGEKSFTDGNGAGSGAGNMIKVTTTIPCSLKTFATFVTAPRSVRYCEDNVVFCDVIEGDNRVRWVHTAYAGNPPFDVVAIHRTGAYRATEDIAEGAPLSKFVSGVYCTEQKNGAPPRPSIIFVSAMKSATHHKVPVSPPYVRLRFHLSAFVAYEVPGPLVQVAFVHVPGDQIPKMVEWCTTKVVCLRNLCQMLEWLSTGGHFRTPGTQVCPSQQGEPNTPSFGCGRTPEVNCSELKTGATALQHGSLSATASQVFETLFSLHASDAWRLVFQYEGCTVEECEARHCFPAPVFLRAYRFATTVACSLETFGCLVGDPEQLHLYDASVESVNVLHSENDGDIVHIHYKQLLSPVPKRDACVLMSKVLLQPREARQRRLYQLEDDVNGVYVQNAIQSTRIPVNQGYDRQVVYAMGYIAIPSARHHSAKNVNLEETGGKLRVYHIVCVDSNMNPGTEMGLASIHQHFARLVGIRNICEGHREQTNAGPFPLCLATDASVLLEKDNFAGFTELDTLEDLSVEETASANDVRKYLDTANELLDGFVKAPEQTQTLLEFPLVEKLQSLLPQLGQSFETPNNNTHTNTVSANIDTAVQPLLKTKDKKTSGKLVQRGRGNLVPVVRPEDESPQLAWDLSVEATNAEQQRQSGKLVQRGRGNPVPVVRPEDESPKLTWDLSVEATNAEQQRQSGKLVQRGRGNLVPVVRPEDESPQLAWDLSVEATNAEQQRQSGKLVQRGRGNPVPVVRPEDESPKLTWDLSVEATNAEQQRQSEKLVQRGRGSPVPVVRPEDESPKLTWDLSVEATNAEQQRQSGKLVQRGRGNPVPVVRPEDESPQLAWDPSVEATNAEQQRQSGKLVQRGRGNPVPVVRSEDESPQLAWDLSVEATNAEQQRQSGKLVQRGRGNPVPVVRPEDESPQLAWDLSVEATNAEQQRQSGKLLQRGRGNPVPVVRPEDESPQLAWDPSVEATNAEQQRQSGKLVQRGRGNPVPVVRSEDESPQLAWDPSVEATNAEQQRQSGKLVQRGRGNPVPVVRPEDESPQLAWDLSVEATNAEQQRQSGKLVQRGRGSPVPVVRPEDESPKLTWDLSVEATNAEQQRQSGKLVQRGRGNPVPVVRPEDESPQLAWDLSVEATNAEQQRQSGKLVQRGRGNPVPVVRPEDESPKLTWDLSVEATNAEQQRQSEKLVQRGRGSPVPVVRPEDESPKLTWDLSVEATNAEQQRQSGKLVQRGRGNPVPVVRPEDESPQLAWDPSVEATNAEQQRQSGKLVQRGRGNPVPVVRSEDESPQLAWDPSVEATNAEQQRQSGKLVQRGRGNPVPVVRPEDESPQLAWDLSVEATNAEQQRQSGKLLQRGRGNPVPVVRPEDESPQLAWDLSVEATNAEQQRQSGKLVQRGRGNPVPVVRPEDESPQLAWDLSVEATNAEQRGHSGKSVELENRRSSAGPCLPKEGTPGRQSTSMKVRGGLKQEDDGGTKFLVKTAEYEGKGDSLRAWGKITGKPDGTSAVSKVGSEELSKEGIPRNVEAQRCARQQKGSLVETGAIKIMKRSSTGVAERTDEVYAERVSVWEEKENSLQEIQVNGKTIPETTLRLDAWPTPDALKGRQDGATVLKLSQRLELRPVQQESTLREARVGLEREEAQRSQTTGSCGKEVWPLLIGSHSAEPDEGWEDCAKLQGVTFGCKLCNTIQVNVRGCRNMPVSHLKRLSFFIQISTTLAEARTELVPLVLNPVFPHQAILLEQPEDDTVNILAIVMTEDGRMKRLGEAVASLRYLHVLDSYTRWISLICNVGTCDACECGEVCITFRRDATEGLGGGASIGQLQWGEAERAPEEEKLRRYIRDVLVSAGNVNLHLLEWLVGNCYRKTSGEIDAFIRRYRKDEPITLTVFEVCGLRSDAGIPLVKVVPCHILVETSRGSSTTASVDLQRQVASLNESFQLLIGVNEPIRLAVFSGSSVIGETLLSTAREDGIHTCVLVAKAGTEEALPCGIITIGTVRGSVSEVTAGPQRRYVELQKTECKRVAYLKHILWMNARSLLHKVDVIAASAMDSKRLLERFGPTTKWYDLRISLKHWRPASTAWDSPICDDAYATHGSGEGNGVLSRHVHTVWRSVYAMIYVGLQQYKTLEVRTDCVGEAHFNETFTLTGVSPGTDEVFVAIMGRDFSDSEDHDLGLAALSLKTLRLQRPTQITTPLVRCAGTRSAHLQGSLYLELFAVNFDGVAANDYEAELCRPSIRSILYNHAPKELHRVECFLSSYAGREKECLKSLRELHGPDILRLPMEIRLVSLDQQAPSSKNYLKVYFNNTVVIRTGNLPVRSLFRFGSEDIRNAVRFLVDDIYDVKLLFKLKQARYLRNKTLGVGSFTLRGSVVSQEGMYWISLVDKEDGWVGDLCVELNSDAFIHNDTVRKAEDDVHDDVTSLIRRYRPSKIPLLHDIMEKTSCREKAHSEIRRAVVGRDIAITVFISVELISVHAFSIQAGAESKPTWSDGETEYLVSARYGGDEGSVTTQNFTPRGKSSTIRLDVCPLYDCRAHKLIITVRRQCANSPPYLVNPSEGRSGSHPHSPLLCKAAPVASKNGPNVIVPRGPDELPESEDVGCTILSLRALFTPLLYGDRELVTVPLVSAPQSVNGESVHPDSRSSTSGKLLSGYKVTGNIAFRVRLAAHEQIPSWMQFDPKTLEKEVRADRNVIRYYEERIRDILVEHKPHSLIDMHYRLYEKYVASGWWHILLHGWKRALVRQFPAANISSDASPYATLTAGLEMRSGDMNSILENLKVEFGDEDSLIDDTEIRTGVGRERIEAENGNVSETESEG